MKLKTLNFFGHDELLFSEKSIIDESADGSPLEEVARINARFFEKPYHKQRFALRLIIWWSVKYYFKILFK